MDNKEQDFLDEQISQRTAENPSFPSLVDEVLAKREEARQLADRVQGAIAVPG